MAVDRLPRGRSLGRALLPLGLLFLVVGVATAVVLPFLSLFLTTAVHAGPVRVAVFLVVAPLAGVASSTLLGHWSDRAPVRRTVLILAAGAGTVGAGLTAVVRDYWILLGLNATATATATALFPQTFGYARQVLARADPDRAALGISTMRTVFSLAWVAGPPLGSLLLHTGGFTAVYAMAAGLYALGALVAVRWLEPIGVPDRPPAPADGVPGSTTGDASRVTLLVTVAAFTALQCPLTLGSQALPLFIATDLHGDVRDAGLLLGLCAALEIPLMLGLGALTTRFRLRRLLLAGATCGAGYYALATAATSLWVLVAIQAVNALFIAAVSGLGISYIQDLLPHRPGQAATMFANAFPIGAMLAGPVLGLAQHVGYRLAYAAATGMCAIGLVLLFVNDGNRRLP